jgi:tRNA(Ile)-lysidine synthase
VDQFLRNLITEWRRLELPFGGSTIVVGTSGGADSVSLLLALDELQKRKKLSHRLIAAHFNHGLRDGASDSDEEFVRSLTTARKIELVVGKTRIDPAGNLEQNARRARYDFLLSKARSVDAFAVLTAHTMNDQAETVLMNLLRGSGPDGLAGMRPIRTLVDTTASVRSRSSSPSLQLPLAIAEIKLIRPLLNWAMRSDTEAYCHELGVEYRYDTMNEDTAYRRVRIRKILLPLLEDFNPRIIATLGNTARLMQNVVDSSGAYSPVTSANELSLEELRAGSGPDIHNKIRDWLKQQRGSTRQLQLKHMEAIERLAFSTKSGRAAELPGGKVIKRNGRLVYEENKVENYKDPV